MSASSSRVRAIQTSGLARPARGHLAQQLADAVVDGVDLVGGAAVAQRRPHEQVDEQADGDADAGVEQPRQQHARVVAEPVVSTTSAVAAAVVVSARSPRTEPASRPTRIDQRRATAR